MNRLRLAYAFNGITELVDKTSLSTFQHSHKLILRWEDPLARQYLLSTTKITTTIQFQIFESKKFFSFFYKINLKLTDSKKFL